jgi:hypothetical protein
LTKKNNDDNFDDISEIDQDEVYISEISQNKNRYTTEIKTTKSNVIDNLDVESKINFDIYIPNVDGTSLFSNELAYEVNFQYSNLFESLINEMLTPDNLKTKDYEFEFESSNPDDSTITEFADQERDYAESDLLENDSIIDDPATQEYSEDTDRD